MQLLRTEFGRSEGFGFVGFQPPLNVEQVRLAKKASLPNGARLILASTREQNSEGAHTEFIYKLPESVGPEIELAAIVKEIGDLICCGDEVCVWPVADPNIKEINNGERLFDTSDTE